MKYKEYILPMALLLSACSTRTITKDVDIPVLQKVTLPDSLKQIPPNPCQFKQCWISPTDPQAKWALSEEVELQIRQWVMDLKVYSQACQAYFE